VLEVLVFSCCGERRVEAIVLDRGHGPRSYLRVKHGRVLAGYCTTVEEVAQHIDLALLVESA